MNTIKCNNRLCGKEYNVKFDNCPFCGTSNPLEESDRKKMMDRDESDKGSEFVDNSSRFNGFVVGIIWISIVFFGIRGVIASFSNMLFSPTIGCLTLGLSIIGIVSLIYVLKAKKWAFIMWVAYRLTAGIVNGFINTKYDFFTNIIISIVNIGLMILILQIRKNGVSAWSIIFNKNKNNGNNSFINKTEAFEDSKKDSCLKTINSNGNNTDTEDNDTGDEFMTISNTFCGNNKREYSLSKESEIIQIDDPEISVIEDTSNDQQESNLNIQDNATQKPCRDKVKKTNINIGRLWIYTLIIIAVLTIVWLAHWFIHRKNEPKLGKYVYVDEYSILHVNRNCDNIAIFHGAKPVTIYSTNEILLRNWEHVCSNCVNDVEYEILEQKVIGNENLRSIYEILINEGYKPSTFSQFITDMEDTNNLKKVNITLKKEGYITPSFDTFLIEVGHCASHSPKHLITFEKSNKKLLYDELSINYDLGTFEDFSLKVEDDMKRKALYDAIKEEYEVHDFAYFTKYLLDN